MEFKYLLQGFLFGLAYVAPIGMQNAYVINTALYQKRNIVIKTALITIFFDVTLALTCFLGVGYVLEKFIILKNIVMVVGAISIIYIGQMLIRSVPDELAETERNDSISKIALRCLIVTWLNPQAIIDGTLLLGGIRATLERSVSNFFIIGTAVASSSWFLALSAMVSLNKSKFSIKILRIINLVCGLIILLYGIKLGYEFVIQFV